MSSLYNLYQTDFLNRNFVTIRYIGPSYLKYEIILSCVILGYAEEMMLQ